MPITRIRFDLGLNESIEATIRQVHSFLEEHKDQAYTASELIHETGIQPNTMGVALDVLLEIAAVDSRNVRSHDYFMYYDELPDLR